MLKKLIFGLFAIVLLAGCGADTTPKSVDADNNQYFGDKITADKAITFEAMKTQLGEAEKMDAKVVGTVESVCQVKGCWMNIVPENGEGEGMFVQFKDYGFFMPKDISGKKVVMDGYAYRDVTPVEDLKHFAEDEGKSQEEIDAITEPEEELKFLASGVVLLNE